MAELSVAELNGAAADREQLQALALTNYGHFTSMRVEDGRVRGLALHLERLRRDCRALFDADLDTDRVRALVRGALGECSPVVVRVTVFDPALELGHPGADAQPDVLVTTRAAGSAQPPPLHLRSVEHRREVPEVKHVGLFGSLRQRRLAQRAGFDDALFTDGGLISEITTSNIGFVDGDRVVWPGADQLPGVTKQLLDDLPELVTSTAALTPSEAAGTDAAFATNAAVAVRPVRALDQHRWPERHPVLDRLRARYAEIDPERL